MRIVSAAAFSLLCACAAPQGPSDGQQTSGSTSDLALRAEPATIASGGSMTLTLDNESGAIRPFRDASIRSPAINIYVALCD